jgi:iron complex outermembrane receptor protein
MALDFNVFHNTVKNYQAEVCLQSDTGGWACIPQNVSEVVAKGFEIDVIGRPMSGLSLTSGIIYVSAEYPDGYIEESGADVSGEQLLNVPEWKFVLSGDYTYGLTATVDAYFAVDGTYRTEYQTHAPYAEPNTMVDGYWDLGCQVGVRSFENSWSVTLWGRNLLDENAHLFAVTETDGETSAIYGTKSFRQVGVSLDYRF